MIQPKIRARLSPESVKERTFLRAEIQGELVQRSFEAILTAEDLERHDASGDGARLPAELTED